MPDRCDLCKHKDRLEMERAYLQGEAYLKISKTYNVPYHAVRNHMQNHLTRQIVQAYERKRLDESFDILNRIDNILSKTETIFERNYDQKRDGMALKAIGEQRNILELLSKISYALHQEKQLEQDADAQDDLEEKEQEVNKALDKLNTNEVQMLFHLQMKMQGETTKTIIHPDWNIDELSKPKPEPEIEHKPMTRTKTPKISALTNDRSSDGYKGKEKENVDESKENDEKTKSIPAKEIPYTRIT